MFFLVSPLFVSFSGCSHVDSLTPADLAEQGEAEDLADALLDAEHEVAAAELMGEEGWLRPAELGVTTGDQPFWSERPGNLREWVVERWSESPARATTTAEFTAAFAVDPDAYLTVEDGAFPATALDRAGNEVSVSIPTEGGGDFPVYIVSTRPTPEDEAQRSEAAPPPASTNYLCLCGIKLTDTKETSSAEFELHVEDGSSKGYNYSFFPQYSGATESSSSSAQYRFDGSKHTDATATSLTFADVNSKTTTYCAAKTSAGTTTGVALKALSSSCYTAVLAVESDDTDGEYRPYTSASGLYDDPTKHSCGSSVEQTFHATLLDARTPTATSTTYAKMRYTTSTSYGSEDDLYGVYFDFTSASPASSGSYSNVKAYTAGPVTLYMINTTNCAFVCGQWATSTGCVAP